MYGGSGVSPAGSPSRRTRQRPSPRCSRSSTAPYRRPARSRRVGRASASHSPPPSCSSSKHLATRLLDPDPSWDHARVVHDDELAAQLVRQIGERAVAHRARLALVDEEARLVPALRRVLCDQLLRKHVVELLRLHPERRVALRPWTNERSNGRRRGSRRQPRAASRRPSSRPRSSGRGSRSRRSHSPPPSSRARCRRRSAARFRTACAPRSSPSRATSRRSAAC